MNPLGQIIYNPCRGLDESLARRAADHEPRLAILLFGARNAGYVAERGRDAHAEFGFEWVLVEVFHHRDDDMPATDLIHAACFHHAYTGIAGLPEPFLLDLGVLRLDLPYFIAHEAMLNLAPEVAVLS
jgi:hypothetical protein